MQRLGAKTPEVPHHVWILQMSLRIPLLAMDEGGKLICPEVEKEKERKKKKKKDKAVRSLKKKSSTAIPFLPSTLIHRPVSKIRVMSNIHN